MDSGILIAASESSADATVVTIWHVRIGTLAPSFMDFLTWWDRVAYPEQYSQ
jgi:hypothetical protein